MSVVVARPFARSPFHTSVRPSLRPLALALSAALFSGISATAVAADADASADASATLDTVHVTAEQIAKQALGTSIITREDIERLPPANDLSEILRRMPGVNLTGNSASGAYGNSRQIDIRGMGPENTLILIDGRRVGSRNSVRMSVAGERNSRGDTNWVPAEAIERIEVLRGPAAARYGSGASGGVVNIITKKPTGDLTGSMTLYAMQPQHSDEGDSQRAGFTLSGPLARDLSFRLYGNVNKTDADSLALNEKYSTGYTSPAGREGVRNKDIDGLLRWDINENQVLEFESGFSRQGNIYAGDRAASAKGTALLTELADEGAETNRLYRSNAAITHRGRWGDISSRLTLGYEGTNNKRLNEGLGGGAEGTISSDSDGSWSTSRLRDYSLDGEINIPTVLGGVDNIWTVGIEYLDSHLKDPYSVTQTSTGLSGVDEDRGGGRADAQTEAVYVEDNIYAGEHWTLTPGVRFDHHSQFGNNFSPSLNVQYKINDQWLVKGGIARAFKAPNLYQSNPNYLYYSKGNGCPDYYSGSGGCYIQGSDNLKPETSINKEIGVEWVPDTGWHASLTYFRNDYKNKIVAGYSSYSLTSSDAYVYQWVNASKALVQGVEGNLKVPLIGDRGSVLAWNTNVTWMIDNKNEATNQPLSIIPEYTVNTSLDWQLTERLSLSLTGTFYGRQEQATRNRNNDLVCGTEELGACSTLGSYGLWGVSGRYRITDKISVGLGVNNIGDKRIFRQGTTATTAGASTYNEPGRSYWASLTFGF